MNAEQSTSSSILNCKLSSQKTLCLSQILKGYYQVYKSLKLDPTMNHINPAKKI